MLGPEWTKLVLCMFVLFSFVLFFNSFQFKFADHSLQHEHDPFFTITKVPIVAIKIIIIIKNNHNNNNHKFHCHGIGSLNFTLESNSKFVIVKNARATTHL